MKIKVRQFDHMAVFIAVLGVVFLFQQGSLRERFGPGTEKVQVRVLFPLDRNLELENIRNIKKVYLGNSSVPSDVKAVEAKGSKVLMTVQGVGALADTKAVVGGQRLAINQRVKIHGLIEVEGKVDGFKKVD